VGLLLVGAGSMSGRGGASARVGCLGRLSGDAPVPLYFVHDYRFFVVPCWHGMYLDVFLTKHSWVSFNCRLHFCMPRKLNTPLLLFSDFGTRFLDQIFCFHNCSAQKPFFGHFGHIQDQAHVGLFQLYPTSLPCHSSRHVENLQDISCCF